VTRDFTHGDGNGSGSRRDALGVIGNVAGAVIGGAKNASRRADADLFWLTSGLSVLGLNRPISYCLNSTGRAC
jgi:hypothetical protein